MRTYKSKSFNNDRQGRVNNTPNIGCQAQSNDKIGECLDQIAVGLLNQEATDEEREAGGAALIKLVHLRVAKKVRGRIREEAEDIAGDAIIGVLAGLEKMRGKCFAFGPSPATLGNGRGYLLGIIDNQIRSAIRKAAKRVSRKQALAWQPLEPVEGKGQEHVHPLDKKSCDDFRARLKEHAPTVHQIQTAIDEAARRGQLIGAALYDLCLEVCESQEQPSPEMPRAPEGMSRRTRQRREQEGAECLAKHLRCQPEM